MPPYKPYASDAQRKALNAMADRGEIEKSEVEGKNQASKGKELPERVGPKKKAYPYFKKKRSS